MTLTAGVLNTLNSEVEKSLRAPLCTYKPGLTNVRRSLHAYSGRTSADASIEDPSAATGLTCL
jgi:hypothetical protein